MPTPFRLIASGLVVTAALAAAVTAQQPRIENGIVTVQPAGSPLAQSFRSLVASQPDVAWVGYSVPASDRERVMCCFNSGTTFVNGTVSSASGCCGACRLETSSGGTSMPSRTEAQSSSSGVIKLEGAEQMVVLFRVLDRKVERVRVFSEDCALDAGGRTVHWLESVRPADSIALLESFTTVEGDAKGRITDGAVSAIARNRNPDRAIRLRPLPR